MIGQNIIHGNTGLCLKMMRGKTIIVTGANSGIGKATTVELLKQQGRVIMACRDQVRAEEAVEEIIKEAGQDNGEVLIKHLDLASLRSVQTFCEEIIKVFSHVQPRWNIDDTTVAICAHKVAKKLGYIVAQTKHQLGLMKITCQCSQAYF